MVGDVVAAEQHAAVGKLGAHTGGRGGGAVLCGERSKHQRLAAVARDERGQVGGGVVELALKAGLGGQQRRHALSLGGGRGVGAHVGGGRHECGDAVFGGLPGGTMDRAQHLLVLGARILEFRVFALEDRDDGRAERGGEQEYRTGDQQDASRTLGRQPRQTVDHRRLSFSNRRRSAGPETRREMSSRAIADIISDC